MGTLIWRGAGWGFVGTVAFGAFGFLRKPPVDRRAVLLGERESEGVRWGSSEGCLDAMTAGEILRVVSVSCVLLFMAGFGLVTLGATGEGSRVLVCCNEAFFGAIALTFFSLGIGADVVLDNGEDLDLVLLSGFGGDVGTSSCASISP